VGPRKAYVDLGEGQLHYGVVAGTGTPIVFFHQTASDWQMWRKIMGFLDLDQPLYAFDTPGFGGSFDPVGPTSMQHYAAWAAEAIEKLSLGQCHIVGHHTGAAIAAELAATRPDLVVSVTLIGPLALTAEDRVVSASLYGAPFLPNESGSYLLDTWEYLRVGGAVADVALIHREMIGMLRAYAARPLAYNAVWTQDFDAAFAKITCPLQIACAEDDVLWPFFLRAQTLRPDATAVVLEAGSNFEPDLDPEPLAAVISKHVVRASQQQGQ
jgi:pimeloyl-ACP methyl ester carboxylesterase